MASSTIDQLLQATKLPRASDEAPRAAESAPPFKPAFEQALNQQPPLAAPTTTPPRDDEPAASSIDAEGQPYDASENPEDSSSEVSAATAGADDVDEAPADETTDDAVEISEQASAAAAASAAKTIPNPAAAVGRKPTAAIGNFQPTEPAGEAAKDNSDTAPDANAPARESAATKRTVTAGAGDAPSQPGRRTTNKNSTVGEKTAAALATNGASDAAEADVIADEDAASVSPASDATSEPTGDRLAADSATEPDGAVRPTKTHAAAEPQSAIVSTDALAAEAAATSGESAGPAPTNDQVPADAIAKPAAADGAATTPARQGASLDRLTAPRSLRPNSTANEGESAPGFDRARFVSRVEGAMRAAHQRDGRVQVRLSPPELGALRIELQMHAGSLTAHIEAETTSARKLLLDNLPALRDRLAQQDIRVEKFEVDVRRDGAGQSSGGGPQDRSADQPTRQPHDGRSRPSPTRMPTPPSRPAPTSAAAITDAGLDVRV